MILYEIIAVTSAVFSAGAIGVMTVLWSELSGARKQMLIDRAFYNEELKELQKVITGKVKDFDDITKKASEANNSQGLKLIELENTVAALDERVAMLNGNATFTGAGKQSWPTKNPLQRSAP